MFSFEFSMIFRNLHTYFKLIICLILLQGVISNDKSFAQVGDFVSGSKPNLYIPLTSFEYTNAPFKIAGPVNIIVVDDGFKAYFDIENSSEVEMSSLHVWLLVYFHEREKPVLYERTIEWEILDHNPLRRLKKIPESDKREVSITVEEAGTLIDELSEPMVNIVEFAIYSGFRKGNILNLKIEDLVFHDLQETSEALIVIKGGKRKRSPLGSHATEVLRRSIGSRIEGFVFLNPRTGTRYGSIQEPFDKALKKLGLKVNGTKLRFHDLRHVFATWLHSAGVSLDDIRELLGHQDRNTTDRYVTSDPKTALKALTVMPRIIRKRA